MYLPSRLSSCLTIVVALLGSEVRAQDSNQFRGPNGNGVYEDQDVPVKWSADENMAWATEIPGAGWSQPAVVGDRIFVTTAVADNEFEPKNFSGGVRTPQSMPGFSGKGPDFEVDFRVVCLSAKDGKIQWDKQVGKVKPEFGIHPSNSFATETPVADANGVYVYFGAAGVLVGLDNSGNQKWQKEIGQFKTDNDFGSGSSLAIHDGKVFLQKFGTDVSDVFCFDSSSGDEVWKFSRDEKVSSWSTPLVWKNKQRTELIVSGGKELNSLDAKTGEVLWSVKKIKAASASSVSSDANRIYFGAKDPFSNGPLFAIQPGGSGDLTPKRANSKFDNCAWLKRGAGPGMASPVAAGELIYIIERNVLRCHDAETGDEIYKVRVPKLGMLAASPIMIGNRLLLLDESGQASVIKAGKEFEVLGESKVDDTFWSTPTAANNAIYLRGLGKLYCIRK